MKNKLKYFTGFDSSGDLFEQEGKIYRGIYTKDGSSFRKIYNKYGNYLSKIGIVNTKIIKNKTPGSDYNFLFEHEKIYPINYPHEWSSHMFRDATIHHLELFLNLHKYNLILKDWHPLNIMFQNNDSVFIDYTSIIPGKDLINEKYLEHSDNSIYDHIINDKQRRYIFEMYRRMFIPYFLLPLFLMKMGKYDFAREEILRTTLHTTFETLNGEKLLNNFPIYLRNKSYFLLNIFSLVFEKDSSVFFGKILNQVRNLKISNMKSDYINYYKSKNGDFSYQNSSNWTNKQDVIQKIIRKIKPGLLLDIGCNTGWFSILASKNHCKVISIDIDDACINYLYEVSKKNKFSITPLVMDITNAHGDIFPVKYENENRKKFMEKNMPLLLSPQKRLRSDMVLVLALVHHLCLGKGMSMTTVIDLLDGFVDKYLVIEFVEPNDKLIIGNPSFFPFYQKSPALCRLYNIKEFIRVLKGKYRKIETFDSDSETRKIILASK